MPVAVGVLVGVPLPTGVRVATGVLVVVVGVLVSVPLPTGVLVTVGVTRTVLRPDENSEVVPSASVTVADKYGNSGGTARVAVKVPSALAIISAKNIVPAGSLLGLA